MAKRVAIVSQDLQTAGGVGTMVRFLYNILRSTDSYEPDVVTIPISSRDHTSLRILPPGIILRRGVRCLKKSCGDLSYTHVGAVLPEIETQRYQPRRPLTNLLQQYDIVHFVSGTPAIASVARDLRKPVLIWAASTIRSDRARRIKQLRFGPRKLLCQLTTRLVEKMEIEALRRADYVFALSEHTYDLVRRYVQNGRVKVAPCGIDTDAFRPRGIGNHVRKRNYILFVGRLDDPRKRVDLLLQAYSYARTVRAKFPELWLVGATDGRNLSELVGRMGLGENACVLGVKQGEALIEMYQGADFVVLPSDEEGLGIVLLEAMACGLAVIATKCGGPEMIVKHGETGYLVERDNVAAFASAMVRLAGDEGERLRMGREARKRAVEQFSLGVARGAFLDVYAAISCPGDGL